MKAGRPPIRPKGVTSGALTALLLAALLGGCAYLPGASQPLTYYVLTDPGPIQRLGQTQPGVLLLREMDSSAFYREPRLAYSRVPGTRSQYEFAYWAELPGKRLTWLLRQRLEASSVYGTVAPLAGGVTGEFQLNTHLIDFYHDAVTPPGTVLLLVEAELIRRSRGELIGRRVFVAQVPVADYSAAGAAEAMNQAANQVIDEITLWLAQSNG